MDDKHLNAGAQSQGRRASITCCHCALTLTASRATLTRMRKSLLYFVIVAFAVAFGLGSCIINRAPDVARPTGPSMVGLDSTRTFRAVAYDPENGPVSVRFDWGDGDSSPWSELTPSFDTVATAHVWRSPGMYLISAQARDGRGAYSKWSSSCSVRVAMVGQTHWRFDPGFEVYGLPSSPAVAADGTVYFCVGRHLAALHPDGSPLWRDSISETSSQLGSAAVRPDGIVLFCAGESLHAIRPNGTIMWRWGATEYCTPPAVSPDGRSFVVSGGTEPRLYAIGADGSVGWSCRIDGSFFFPSPPAIGADGVIYVRSGDSCLLAVNSDRTNRWKCGIGSSDGSSPALDNGIAYVGSGDSCLYAITWSGTLSWRFKTGGPILSSPTIGVDGTVYIGSEDGITYAVRPDGSLKWRYDAGAPIASSPAICADGRICFTAGGFVHVVGPDGSLDRFFPIEGLQYSGYGASCPAIGPDGTLYVGVPDYPGKATLRALGGSSPLANSAWPKYQHDNENRGCMSQ